MSPSYDAPPRRGPSGPEDLVGLVVLLGCAVLAFCWYVAVSRLHLRNAQCMELFMDFAILLFGTGLIIAQLAGRRRKREENWPHPPYPSRECGTDLMCTTRTQVTLPCWDTTSTRNHGYGRTL